MAFDLNTWGQQYGLTDAQKASLQAVLGSDDFIQKTRAYNMMYGSDNADATRALDAAKQLGILNQTLSGAGASPSGGSGQTYGTWNVSNTGSTGSLDATPWGTTGAAPAGVMDTPGGVMARPDFQRPLQRNPSAPSWEEMLGRFGQLTAKLPPGSFAPGAGYGEEAPFLGGALQGLGWGGRQKGVFDGGRPGRPQDGMGYQGQNLDGSMRQSRGYGYGALPQMLAQRQRPGYQAPAGSTPYGYGALAPLFGNAGRSPPVRDTRYRGALVPFGQPNPLGATPQGANRFGIRALGG